MRGGVGREALEQLPAKPAAAEWGPHVHALQLAVLTPVELDTAASDWRLSDASDEENDTLADQLVDAVAVPAFGGIARGEVGFELVDQRARVRRVRTL